MNLTVEVQGIPEATAKLDRFGKGVKRKHLRIAVSAGGGVLKPEVIRRAPRDTGTLAKHQIVKAKVTKDGEGAYALVGAKRGIRVVARGSKTVATFRTKKDGTVSVAGEKRLKKEQAKGGKLRTLVPSRYSHLAEKKHGYLAKSVVAKKEQVKATVTRKLREGVLAEAAKP